MPDEHTSDTSAVRVVDIRMPFWSMVFFMVKASIAAIPALVILVVLGTVIASALSGMLLGFAGHSRSVSSSLSSYVPAPREASIAYPTEARRAAFGRCMNRPDYVSCTGKLSDCVRTYPSESLDSAKAKQLESCLTVVGR